jgi:hypothetical protein
MYDDEDYDSLDSPLDEWENQKKEFSVDEDDDSEVWGVQVTCEGCGFRFITYSRDGGILCPVCGASISGEDT